MIDNYPLSIIHYQLYIVPKALYPLLRKSRKSSREIAVSAFCQ